MAVPPEGTPCWADAMFGDVEGAKTFYGDVLGWTFGESTSEYGNYTQAYANGRAVAAVVPPMPGQEGQSQWCLYFASPDAAATAARIRENGGEVLMEPMRVGEFGTMCLAREPGGAVFGVWQGGLHTGFEATAEPGAYCWAEVFTREPEKTDAFLPAVFSYTAKQLQDDAVDFRMFDLGDRTVLGRMRMTDEIPARGALVHQRLLHRRRLRRGRRQGRRARCGAPVRSDGQPVRPVRGAQRPAGGELLGDRHHQDGGGDAEEHGRLLIRRACEPVHRDPEGRPGVA